MSHVSRVSGQAPEGKKHYMVPDASALIALMKNFTDIYSETNQTLEQMVTPKNRRSAPMLDKILIPDHTLYEVTGITAMTMPTMLQRFREAAHDPEALERWVDLYVAASPRNDTRLQQHHIRKAQVRGLLRFVAQHPDWVVETDVSKRYAAELKTDYAVLAGVGDADVLQQYRPSIGDVMDVMGDAFSLDNLRVHYGQLWMMGVVNEADYSKRMQQDEKAKGNQRFITTTEWNRLLKAQEKLSEEELDEIKQMTQQSEAHSDQGKQYLTVGMLKSFPHILARYRFSEMFHGEKTHAETKRWYDDTKGGHGVVANALRPSKLLMEQLFYGGIIPLEAMGEVAKLLGYDVEESASTHRVSTKQQLHRQGFFERTTSCAELRTIYDGLIANGYAPEKIQGLRKLNDGLKHITEKHRDRLNQACQNRDSGSTYLSGTPYEKMLAQELINGTVSFEEFTHILRGTNHGLIASQGRLATKEGDIVIELAAGQPSEQARIWINQEGFGGRNGHTDISAYHYDKAHTLRRELVRGAGHKDYVEFQLDALIEICRHNRRLGHDNKVYRVFESLLYPSVLRDASGVRAASLDVLGEDRLVQLEKDFSNRHIRRIQTVLPPCADLFSAQHVNRRIARKNLGEIATAEVATKLAAEQGEDAKVWIANHDMDLMPKANRYATKTDMDGTLYFSDRLHRMTSHLEPELRALEADMDAQQKDGRLDFVGSQQLLETARQMTGRAKLSADNSPIVKTEISKRVGRENRLPDNLRWLEHMRVALSQHRNSGHSF